MKKYLQLFRALIILLIMTAGIAGCDDDSGPSLTGDNTVYTLGPKSDPGIDGNVTFSRQSDNSVLITIQLNGTQAGGDHPAHIHADNAIDGGTILLDLSNVEGASGRSETVVTALNDGTPISYEELIDFDGYVNVHASTSDLGTLIAQGDIGQNALTDLSKTYVLNPVSDPSISGTVKFEERLNGEGVATVTLDGTTAGNSHPAHIHFNSAAEGGGIAIDFNAIDGETGIGRTNITQLRDGTPITYSDLLEFDGYVNVHLSGDDLGTLVAQGDIGGNELTGELTEYALGPVSDPGISGTATFAERVNGFTLVTVALAGTTEGNSHPSHIHNNSAAEGGGIAVDFNPIDGGTGMSRTNIRALNDETPITYAELLEFDGYVNVHLSSDNLGTLVAQGNIGSNVE
ncbi:MAG TPA: CHRD domain-containing protein [Cyclobacteriaceae bacterium]|nr:CHRD domain-containing protein [Cyclobacteriaceae bacterium]